MGVAMPSGKVIARAPVDLGKMAEQPGSPELRDGFMRLAVLDEVAEYATGSPKTSGRMRPNEPASPDRHSESSDRPPKRSAGRPSLRARSP